MNWSYILLGLIVGATPGIMIIMYEEYRKRVKQ